MERHTGERLHDATPGNRQGRPLSLLPLFLAAWLTALAGTLSAAPQAETAGSDAGGESTVDLVAIPYPDMSGLEEAVEDQINEAHKSLQGWLRQDNPPSNEVAAAFGRLGKLLHAYELFAAAEACYRNAAYLEPTSFHWRYYLGHVLQKSGQFENASVAYRAALELEPRNLAAHVRLGEVYRTQNRTDEATAELRLALELDPQNPAAQAYLGELALARGDHREAVELLSAVLARVPAADRLHYPLAMAYRGIGERDKALQHLDQVGVVGITVEDPLLDALQDLATGERVHLLRGRQAFNAGRYSEAAGEFRQALEADPRSARVRVNLGSAQGQLGDVLGAIEQYRVALELDPSNFTAHYNIGLLQVGRGEHESAARHFEAAIELKYDDSETHRQLGLVLRRLGRPEEALEHLREASSLEPRSENARLDEVVQLVQLGHYKDALERLEDAHALQPQSGAITHALARMLASAPEKDLRDGERALDLAQRVYEVAPSLGHAVTVAQALAELGRCSEAADWQRQIVESAEQQGQTDWSDVQRSALERYEAGAPCR